MATTPMPAPRAAAPPVEAAGQHYFRVLFDSDSYAAAVPQGSVALALKPGQVVAIPAEMSAAALADGALWVAAQDTGTEAWGSVPHPQRCNEVVRTELHDPLGQPVCYEPVQWCAAHVTTHSEAVSHQHCHPALVSQTLHHTTLRANTCARACV